jgi:hypothetical protein
MVKRNKPWFVLFILLAPMLSTGCMPGLLHSTIPTQTTSPTRALQPTSTDTVVPSPTPDNVQVAAWVSIDRPGWGSVQTVFARMTKGSQGVAGAQMYSIVHDQDADRRWPGEGFEPTGADGIASVSFVVPDARAGYIVNVDVYLTYEGRAYRTDASFAPQC